MTSKLVVNTIESDTGISSVSFASSISMSSTSKFFFSAAGIDIGADTNINRPEAGVLGFNINGGEKVRINSNGFIGINTSSPLAPLHTYNDTNNTIARLESGDATCRLQLVDSAGMGFVAVSGDNLILANTSSITERLRIGSNGGVGINTSLIRNNRFLNIAAPSQDFSNNSVELMDGGGICLQHTDTLASTNRTYPGIFWSGNTASLGRSRAAILGITASNNDATHIAFLTRYAANGTGLYPSDERMRITSGGSVNIGGDYTQTSRKLAVNGSALFKATEADIWLESTGPNGVWRILGSTGGNTHQFRIYDNTNAADRFVIDSNGRVIIGDTSTTNASGNADDLVISGSGQKGITIHSTVYGNIYFSDGSGSNQYVGYCQYNHNNNHLNLGAGGAQRVMIYDKDGASGTTKAVLQVGGSAGNNHYNNYQNASITFGGGNDIENYFIGTRMENYGGNYTKLDLRWHTGIRMGAQQGYGGIRFYDNEDLGSVKFSIMSGADAVTCHTTLRPAANNTYNLGNSSFRWGTLYASNATNTSDRNEKNTITESDLGLDFICKLKPVSYKWNQLVDREGEGLDTKTHYGLISQDVEESVIASGKTLDDFGAIDKPEGDDPMGLSYHEFISPLIKAIQEQQEQIKILQEKIASLEES